MKKFLSVICILALCLSLCACGKTEITESKPEESIIESEPTETETSKGTLALCMGSVEHPTLRLTQYGFIKTANELGYKAKICGLSDGSMVELLAEWGTLLTDTDIQGVAVWNSSDAVYELLRNFRENGIHTVVPYWEHDYTETHEFIECNPCEDQYAEGTALAEFLLQKLKEKGINKGTIGMTRSRTASIMPDSYEKGFTKVFESTDYTMANPAPAGAELQEGIGIAEKYLNEYPDMIAAFSLVTGGNKAWTQAKANTNRNDVTVVGCELGEPIDDTDTEGFMIQPIYEAGVEAAKALAALNEGKTYTEAEWNPPLPVNIVDREGYAEYEARYNEAQEYFAK